MAEKMPQTLANHTKLDPLFHFVVLPVFALSAIGGTIHFPSAPQLHSGSFFVISGGRAHRGSKNPYLCAQSAGPRDPPGRALRLSTLIALSRCAPASRS